MQNTARIIGRRTASWRANVLRRLQRKRNKILREYKISSFLHPNLPNIEKQISVFQQQIAANAILRAGRHWREHGEKSAGYLKRTISSRSARRLIPELQHPLTSASCTTPTALQDAVVLFYSQLYSPEPIDYNSVSTLTSSLHSLASTFLDALTAKVTLDELIEGASRSPRSSCPGTDGIPYELNYYLSIQLLVH